MIHFSSGLRHRGDTYLLLVWVDTSTGRNLLLNIPKPKWLIEWQDDLDGRHSNRA